MAVPNPIYIDESALHKPPVIRNMAYNAVVGQEGVLGSTHLAIKALATPGNQVQAMPGAFSVLARHLGGDFEGYSGKYSVAELSPTISATTSSGGRTDLVILVIRNPYVSGAGSWDVPADPVNGPYAFIDVIEGVPPNTNSIRGAGSGPATWSAITLSRITRGANTNVIIQDNITDLRSLAQLGGTRTEIITSPPATVPPIAQASYMEFKASSTTVTDMFTSVANTWKNWPLAASWSIPVPAWAISMDIDSTVYGVQIQSNNPAGDIYGQMQMLVNGVAQTPLTLAIDFGQVAARHNLGYGGTFAVPSTIRGKVVTFRWQTMSYYDGPGRLEAMKSTSKILVNFQRTPDVPL